MPAQPSIAVENLDAIQSRRLTPAELAEADQFRQILQYYRELEAGLHQGAHHKPYFTTPPDFPIDLYRDYYEVLGVSPPDPDLFTLAKGLGEKWNLYSPYSYHRNIADAWLTSDPTRIRECWEVVKSAYLILSDSVAKKQYDEGRRAVLAIEARQHHEIDTIASYEGNNPGDITKEETMTGNPREEEKALNFTKWRVLEQKREEERKIVREKTANLKEQPISRTESNLQLIVKQPEFPEAKLDSPVQGNLGSEEQSPISHSSGDNNPSNDREERQKLKTLVGEEKWAAIKKRHAKLKQRSKGKRQLLAKQPMKESEAKKVGPSFDEDSQLAAEFERGDDYIRL